MKLGMSGGRTGLSKEAKDILIKFIKNNKIVQVHHGDCIGSDKEFHDICVSHNIKTIIHPPDDNKLRSFCKGDVILSAKKYLERNHDIVDESVMIIAFPSTQTEVLRSGTWSTIRYAKKKNKKIFIVYPNGHTETI